MPTYKVDELEGQRLDAAVALAEGYVWDGRHFSKPPRIIYGKTVEVYVRPGDCRDEGGYPVWNRFHPSGDREQGGEIIEREGIRTGPVLMPYVPGCEWDAVIELPQDAMVMARGRTLLESAMKAWVKRKCGDTVELPW